jgi:Dolichyl-phosphate-mannose-protein mannosyltransferase
VTDGATAARAPGAQRVGARLARWLAPLLVVALAARAIDTYPVGIVHDDSVYVALAKALATGSGLRYLNLPGTPWATHFPPGYPLLLASLWRIFPSFPANVLVFKAANALLVGVAAACIAVLARARFECTDLEASVASILVSIGVPTFVLSALVMSEPLFLVVALLALLVGERVVAGDRRPVRVAAAGAVTGLATLVRSHGVALVAALIVMLLLRRRRRDALVAAGAALVIIAPWQAWVHAHAGGLPAPLRGTYGPYGAWYFDAVRAGGIGFMTATVASTAHAIAAMFEAFTMVAPTPAAGIVALCVLLPLTVLGARRTWVAAPLTVLFLTLYVAIVLVWPYSPDRFLWGIWPLLVALPLIGIRALWRWDVPARVPRAARAWLLAVAAVPTLGYLRYNVNGYRDAWWENLPRTRGAELREVVMGVRDHAPPDAVVSSTDDAAIFLYTGRLAVPNASMQATDFLKRPTIAHDATTLHDILTAYHVDALVVTTEGEQEVAEQLVARRPPELALSDSFPGGLIYSPIVR